MHKVILTAQAKRDLEEIRDYIAHRLQNPTAAKSTLSAITRALRQLASFPKLGPVLDRESLRFQGERLLVCGQYLAFYREDEHAVIVHRVLYGRRNYAALFFDLEEET